MVGCIGNCKPRRHREPTEKYLCCPTPPPSNGGAEGRFKVFLRETPCLRVSVVKRGGWGGILSAPTALSVLSVLSALSALSALSVLSVLSIRRLHRFTASLAYIALSARSNDSPAA